MTTPIKITRIQDKKLHESFIQYLTKTSIVNVKNLALFYQDRATNCAIIRKYRGTGKNKKNKLYEALYGTPQQEAFLLGGSLDFLREADCGDYIVDVVNAVIIHSYTKGEPVWQYWRRIPPMNLNASILAVDYSTYESTAYIIPGTAYLPQVIWVRNKINKLLYGREREKMTLFGFYYLASYYLGTIKSEILSPEILSHFIPEMGIPQGVNKLKSESTNKLLELFACSSEGEEEPSPLYLTKLIKEGFPFPFSSSPDERKEVEIDMKLSFNFRKIIVDGDTLIVHTSDPKVTEEVVRKEIGLGDEGTVLIWNPSGGYYKT